MKFDSGGRRRTWLFSSAGWLLILATLAGTLAVHDHNFLTPETENTPAGDLYVTRHNPLSRASHWHAVIRVDHEHHCVACQFHRLPGNIAEGHRFESEALTRRPGSLSPIIRLAGFLASSPSRAPPALL
jgi:hypothetical protein